MHYITSQRRISTALIAIGFAVYCSASLAQWKYLDSKDKMRGTSTPIAYTYSLNKVDFEFPYSGGSRATLVVPREKDGDIRLLIDKGQFYCNDRCTISIKFDNGSIETYQADSPDTGSSKIIIVDTNERLWEKLFSSKRMLLEAPFFQSGGKQFSFNVSGLKPVRYDVELLNKSNSLD